MESRFEKARDYLIDLLRAYGHRLIIVKIAKDGEEIRIMAKNFVKRQLTAVEIVFPYNEGNKRCTKIINPDLDEDMLSIIFHRAVFELETAYLEEFYQDKSESEAYINSIYSWIERKQEWIHCTFSYYENEDLEPFLEEIPEPELQKGDLSVGLEVTEEDIKALKDMGYQQISSVHAMAQLFWAFASYRIPIGKLMKNAILSITVDEEAADYLNSYSHFYNRFIQEKIEKKSLPGDVKEIEKLGKKHQCEINALNKKHQDELKQLKKHFKEEKAELNRMHQEDLHDKLLKSKTKAKKFGAVVKKFRQELLSPQGKFRQTYDLTKEEDIKDFISWFSVIHKKVKNQTVKNIIKMTFVEDEEKAALFKRMVEEYNSSLLVEDTDEDENEE